MNDLQLTLDDPDATIHLVLHHTVYQLTKPCSQEMNLQVFIAKRTINVEHTGCDLFEK